MTVLKCLTIAAVAALLALMLHNGDPGRWSWWPLALPFALWITGPAVLPFVLAKRAAGRRRYTQAMTLFLIVSSIASGLIYYEAFFRSQSSTAALILIFVPLYQWAALLGVDLLCALAGGLRARGDRS